MKPFRPVDPTTIVDLGAEPSIIAANAIWLEPRADLVLCHVLSNVAGHGAPALLARQAVIVWTLPDFVDAMHQCSTAVLSAEGRLASMIGGLPVH